eukprot:9822005-Alexandrium_andersonii.AAC.1
MFAHCQSPSLLRRWHRPAAPHPLRARGSRPIALPAGRILALRAGVRALHAGGLALRTCLLYTSPSPRD